MQRPRLAEELDTTQGGGVVFRQAPHLVDIARYLAGGMAVEARARIGRHDPRFATEGDYFALLTFDGSTAATLSFNGYGFFDSSELTGGYGEGGNYSDPAIACGRSSGGRLSSAALASFTDITNKNRLH